MAPPTLALLAALAFAPVDPTPADTLLRLPILGGPVEDRIRTGQLLGDEPSEGWTVRSPSSMLGLAAQDPDRAGGQVRLRYLAPELHTVWNSELPFSLNEGSLWAGRGLGVRLTGGGVLQWRRLTLVAAPHVIVEENRDFQTVSHPDGAAAGRHPFASPFHLAPHSMDLPQRFGTATRGRLEAGQTSLRIDADALAFGFATENVWWGPGVRNALLMGSQAPGVPHVFLESGRPFDTPLGALRFRWMLGRLSESDYFDRDDTNDHRSLSGLVLTLSPSFDPGLSLGIARTVFAPSDGFPIEAALDVFHDVGRPAAEPGDTLLAPGRDQLFSVFARWVFPEAGFEVYGEWGRHEQPASLRDFLEVPQHSRAYTVGLQYVRPAGEGRLLRLQSEITSLEPSQSFRVRQLGEWYASRPVPHGYTHRGRVIGAAIGPSGSSQWAAADWTGERWRAGMFFGRIRWENQALYTYLPEFRRADVSLLPGVRAGGVVGPFDLDASYTYGMRLNYLFQARPVPPNDDRGVDLLNHTLRLTLSTRGP